jgi:hypothetical protein
MPNRLALALLPFALVALAGCAKSPRDQLQGKWRGEGIAKVHSAQVQHAEGWARGLSLEFKGGAVIVGLPAESPRQGTFSVGKIQGSEVDITFKRPGGTEDKSRMRFEKDGKVTWLLDGAEIKLTKLDG